MQRAITVVVLLFIGGICSFAYGHNNTYQVAPPITGSTVQLTNPEVLQNWLPAASYTYTMQRIDDYLSQNSTPVTSMTAQDEVLTGSNAGTYNFNITILPQEQTLGIAVTVSNLGGLMSTAVSINGTIQTPSVSSSIQTSTGGAISFTGTDALLSDGVMTEQITIFEQAFQKYEPAASSVTIDTDHIGTNMDGDGNFTYQFPVTVDGTSYTASLTCDGATQARLIVTGNANKKIFDTGMMTGN